MSAETLRKAAALMRERAEGAKGDRPEWFVDENGYGEVELWARHGEWDYFPQPVIDEHSLRKTPGAFAHFAALTPAVALAVADWLDRVALTKEKCNPWQAWWLNDYHAALDVARTYLGETS